MAKSNKEQKTTGFRLQLLDDMTHRQIWVLKFGHTGLAFMLFTVVLVIAAGMYLLVSFTPLKIYIPGYPDAESQRAAITNALRIDSLERVVARWQFYSENMRRVIDGEDPVLIDSIIRKRADSISVPDAAVLAKQDSILRSNVSDAEQFGLSIKADRALPIEAVHFFSPLKGVVSQGYDPAVHPYIDVTAPEGSVVMAVLDGTVVFAGWSDEGGYTVHIQHPGDLISVYKHNEKLLRRVGEKVVAGSSIALLGNTGSLTTGAHLHFELWYKGEAVDPTLYIGF